MREATFTDFDTRAGFHAAVIAALETSRHAVTLIDRDFEHWPLESAAGEQALRGALARGARLRVLVSRPDWLERHASRFARLRRAHAGQIECREVPANLRLEDSALVADGQHLVKRAHCDGFQGRMALASPSAVEALGDRYQAVWDESTPCLPATTLGL